MKRRSHEGFFMDLAIETVSGDGLSRGGSKRGF